MEYKDYYQILGVGKNATQGEIKKAFKKLARQYHPDVNKDAPAAETKFKEINEAYQALGDEENRQKYDQFGSQWEQYQQTGGNPQDFWGQYAGGGTRTVSPEEFAQMFGGSGGANGFSDFFDILFGGGRQAAGFDSSPFGQFNQSAQVAGYDLEHTVQLTLDEAFHGAQRTLTYEDGRSITAKIPAGVTTGKRIRLSGKGQPGANGAPAGNLYLNIEVTSNSRFERSGDDLKTAVSVDLYTLLLGGTADVTTIDKTVKLTIPAGTENGKQFRLRGLGMPKLQTPDQRGDLLAKVTVELPRALSDDERTLFEQLRALKNE
ncbi:MAG: J domain-containing protein [Chloroflexota bacterium]